MNRISVSYFQRRPRPGSDYSVEVVFEEVRRALAGQVSARLVVSPFVSRGALPRLGNLLWAPFAQSTVNHVTGDISYVGISLRRRATIQTVLDCNHLEVLSGLRRRLVQLLWFEIPLRRCEFITVISESTKSQLHRVVGIDPSRVRVIPVPLSPRFARDERPFSKEHPRVLQIGTASNKNVPRLIEALRGTKCTLDLIGKKDAGLCHLLRESGIQHTYRSGLSPEEIVAAYRNADIVTLASTSEGFGMPIIEAQATGRVVVTSRLSSMPEVAGDGACLVDPFDVESIRDGVRRVIDDDAYREQLVERGASNARRFEPGRVAGMYLDLYRRAAALD